MQITTIGLDLAKNTFQAHGVDAEGRVVVRRQLRRKQVRDFFAGLAPCLIGMEACGTASANLHTFRKGRSDERGVSGRIG